MTREGPAHLTEDELRARLRRVVHPNPMVHVGPAYPIQSFEHWDNPYPGYYHGAVVMVDSWLGESVWVEEHPPPEHWQVAQCSHLTDCDCLTSECTHQNECTCA